MLFSLLWPPVSSSSIQQPHILCLSPSTSSELELARPDQLGAAPCLLAPNLELQPKGPASPWFSCRLPFLLPWEAALLYGGRGGGGARTVKGRGLRGALWEAGGSLAIRSRPCGSLLLPCHVRRPATPFPGPPDDHGRFHLYSFLFLSPVSGPVRCEHGRLSSFKVARFWHQVSHLLLFAAELCRFKIHLKDGWRLSLVWVSVNSGFGSVLSF